MSAEDSGEQRWQDRFDELAVPSAFLILAMILTWGKITGWEIPTTMRGGGILSIFYNPVGIIILFIIGGVWLYNEL